MCVFARACKCARAHVHTSSHSHLKTSPPHPPQPPTTTPAASSEGTPKRDGESQLKGESSRPTFRGENGNVGEEVGNPDSAVCDDGGSPGSRDVRAHQAVRGEWFEALARPGDSAFLNMFSKEGKYSLIFIREWKYFFLHNYIMLLVHSNKLNRLTR